VNRLHLGVTGRLTSDAGAFAAGTPYAAHDPELMRWVFATLVDTGLLLYPLFFAPLTAAEQERYYQESRRSVTLLGLSLANTPATLADFRGYMARMLASDQLAATPEALDVARTMMRMPAPAPLRPLLWAVNVTYEQATVALLPPRLRQMYGY